MKLPLTLLLLFNISITVVELIGDSRSPSQKFVNWCTIITNALGVIICLKM